MVKKIPNFLIYIILSVVWLFIIDPTSKTFQLSNSSLPKFPNLICYDLPMCFRVLSLDIHNLFSFIVHKFFFILNIKLNHELVAYYIIAFCSLIYIFRNIKKIINNDKTYTVLIIYIFLTLLYFKLPLLRVFDYFVIIYFLYIIKYFDKLTENFFSIKSIILLSIGTIIFEYAGLLYGTSIIIYNFICYKFKKIKFQIRHFILPLIPLVILVSLYLIISNNENYFWVFKNEQDIRIVWKEYGQFNNKSHIIKSLLKYSFLFFIFCFIIIRHGNYKFSIFSEKFKNKKNVFLISMILAFFCAVTVGKFTSGFKSEWQRQFMPYLFLISILGANLYNSKKE